MTTLTYPFREADVRALRAGDTVSVNGTIWTGRDRFHKHFADGGRLPVLMELLSPGFKPVQLTQDLRSFWQNTYFDVRGELRRRYPKHYWPDNPLEAEAVRGTKKRPSLP